MNHPQDLYEPSVDIFSLGILAIFILGQVFPSQLLSDMYTDETGSQIARSELEKREEILRPIIASLTRDHPLIKLIHRSLNNDPAQRPPIEELQCMISRAMEMCGANDGVTGRTRFQAVQTLHHLQKGPVQESLHRQIELVHEKMVLEEELLMKKAQLDAAMERLERLRQERDGERSPREEVTAPEQANVQQSVSREPQCPAEASASPVVPESPNMLKVQCYHQKPVKLDSPLRGSATIDGNFAYLTPRNTSTVFRYNTINGEGMEFRQSLYQNSSVVSMEGRMVLIGGSSEGRVTNKLLTLDYTGQWIEEYPSMNTARSSCAVLCITNERFRTHVMVIGGNSDNEYPVDNVEFLNTVTKTWYTFPSLPQTLPLPGALVCGNTLYAVGSNGVGYSCSIQNLLSYNDDAIQPPPSNIIWTPLPKLPVTQSSIATLHGELVSIGGYKGSTACRAIYQLVEQEWVEIGSTLVSRRCSLTVCASRDKVIILGGEGVGNSVELCNAEQ